MGDETGAGPAGGNEIWVYAPSHTGGPAGGGAFTAKGGVSQADEGLRRVTVSDDELRRLTGQVDRMVRVLESQQAAEAAGAASGQVAAAAPRRYQVDAITVHLGVSASGRFFFVAEAGMDASIEITWKRS